MSRLQVLLSLSAATLLIPGSPVRAQQRWLRLGDFGHPTYLDTTVVVRRTPTLAVVRVRFVGYAGAGYDRIETEEVNCQTHQSRTLRGEDLAVGARNDDNLAPEPADSVWRSYVPGSFGARLLAAVCGYLQLTSRT